MTNGNPCIGRSEIAQRSGSPDIGSEILRQMRAWAILPSLWRLRRSERRHLRSLENHVLADLGLTRAEVEREARKPFWQPVSPRRIAGERDR